MKNNFIIDTKKRNKVLNNFLSGLLIKIVNDYLHFLENNNNNTPELILNYLDQSLLFIKKKINIDKLNDKIEFMNDEERKKINSFLLENTEYKKIYNRFSFVLNVIKSKQLQEKTFLYLYDEFLKNKNLNLKKEQKNIAKDYIDDIFKKIKISQKLLCYYNFKQKVTN